MSPERTDVARTMVREFLQARPDRSNQRLWVRINLVVTETPAAMFELKTNKGASSRLLGLT